MLVGLTVDLRGGRSRIVGKGEKTFLQRNGECNLLKYLRAIYDLERSKAGSEPATKLLLIS